MKVNFQSSLELCEEDGNDDGEFACIEFISALTLCHFILFPIQVASLT